MNNLKIILLGSLIFTVLACGSSDTKEVVHHSITGKKDIEWIKMVGVDKNENNNLKKTTITAWDNAGASSKNILPEAKNGWVEMTVDETNTHRILGLSEKDINANYPSIQYGIYLTASSGILVYEKGSSKGSFGEYSKGDRLKVQRIEGKIQYLKNDSLLYTSAIVTSAALTIDVAMYSIGSTIKDVKSSFK